MTTTIIKILSYPFALLGFVYQFIAGSFYAGRIESSLWIRGVAVRASGQRGNIPTPTPTAASTAAKCRHGLH